MIRYSLFFRLITSLRRGGVGVTCYVYFFFFSSRRRHTRCGRDWSSDVCSSDLRPWSLHRNGFAGVQRYGGWIWSGDVQSRWATLAAHVPVGVNYSLSLTPFWGTDTGGFIPTRDLTGELYARWFQFSTFNPLFRSHGRTWKLRLPWGWNTGETGPLEERVRP